MIISALIGGVTLFFSFIFSLLPNIPLDGFGGLAGGLSTVIGHMAKLDNWIPFDSLGVSLAIVLLVVPMGLVVKVFRMGISLVTGGGGSAA